MDARGGPVAGIGAKAGQSPSRGAGVVRTVNGQGCVVGTENLCEEIRNWAAEMGVRSKAVLEGRAPD